MKNYFKRFFIVLVVVAMLFSFTACNNAASLGNELVPGGAEMGDTNIGGDTESGSTVNKDDSQEDIYANAEVFTVTFYVRLLGGNGFVRFSTEEVKSGGKISPLKEETGAGYIYSGYYTEKEMITEWDFNNNTVEKNISIFVVREFMSYIRFEANGGKNIMKAQFMAGGTTDELRLNTFLPMHENYAFIGWALTKDGEVELVDGESYTMNENGLVITLYAVWEIDHEYYTPGSEFQLNNEGTEYAFVGINDNTITSLIIPSYYLGKKVTTVNGTGTGLSRAEKLKYIYVPDSVTLIKTASFAKCVALTSVRLPSGLKKLESGTFFLSTALTTISLPNSIEEIGVCAFTGTNIRQLFLPKSLVRINCRSFERMTALTTLSISEDNAFFSTDNGILYNKDKTMLLTYPHGRADKTFTVPSFVTRLGAYAFSYAPTLVNLIIPQTVSSVDVFAISDFKESQTVSICGYTEKPKGWATQWLFRSTTNVVWNYTAA